MNDFNSIDKALNVKSENIDLQKPTVKKEDLKKTNEIGKDYDYNKWYYGSGR